MTPQFKLMVSLLPTLAESSPKDLANHAGYIVGTVLTLVAIIAMPIFSIVAVVKAFSKKTTGWIVAGSISGAILVVFILILMTMFVRGFIQGFERSRQSTAESSAASIQPERIIGEVFPFTIEKPAGWHLKRKQNAYDVLLNNSTDFVGVIAEEADLGGAENVAELVRKKFESQGAEVSYGDNEPIMIDGRKWIGFTVRCKIQNLPFAYQYYVYSDKEGTLQVTGWTYQNLWERESKKLREVMQTFRFPVAKDANEEKQ
jgi:hypothetical protein